MPAVVDARLPRVPTSLECEWLDARLKKTGRNGFLGAETVTSAHLRNSAVIKAARSRELLMSVANDKMSTPRDFKHVRRLRAVLEADVQRRKTKFGLKKSGAKGDEAAMAAQQRKEVEDQREQREDDRKRREARPLVGIGSMVRTRDVDQPTYGWGTALPNAPPPPHPICSRVCGRASSPPPRRGSRAE